MRAPLNYQTLRVTGSHRILVSDDYRKLTFWPHHGKEITPTVVKHFLINRVGLSIQEALELLQ
jgi:predicted RNA binding protein YcfA (HicA-like mRNA interferase family)